MPEYYSEEFDPELAGLIERPSKDDEDLAEPSREPPGPDFLTASTNPDECVELCSPLSSTELFPSPVSPRSDSTTPGSDSSNSLDDHPLIFYHYERPGDPDLNTDTILHWYGEKRRSLEDNAEESLQHDKALVDEYIRNNSKLSAQLAFMKKQRKKKQPDKNLVEDYRFIVSLHTALKKMEFKPHQRVSSKAILTCLDVTPSWLSRAKQVVDLLKKFGPDASSPDPLVMKRLRSNVVTHKGSDLLTFLKHTSKNTRSSDPYT